MDIANSLAARSLRSVWHPCTQMRQHERTPPIALASAHGPWLVDTDGRRYFDAISSWWVNLFGHANPHINAALKTQLDSLEHVMLAGATLVIAGNVLVIWRESRLGLGQDKLRSNMTPQG